MNKKLYVRIKDLGIHTTAPSNTYRGFRSISDIINIF